MAFSTSSYIAGVATAFVAVAVGFAGGAMITTSAVQQPNRLERVTSSALLPPSESPKPAADQPNQTSSQNSATPPAPTAAAAAPADTQAAQQPAPAEPALSNKNNSAAKSEAAAKPPTASPAVRSENTSSKNENATAKNDNVAPARNGRASVRSDSRRDAYRRRAEDRKYDERRYDDRKDDRKLVDRKRRQDLDDATDTVRQMRRDGTPDQVVVEREEPAAHERRPPRFGLFGSDDDPPRSAPAPSPFGFFGN